MQPQWDADILVDAERARRLIVESFPEMPCDTVVPFGQGWDNAAFLVDDRVLFRFPRRRVAAHLIDREIAVLPRLAPHLPLAISSPAFVGTPNEAFPYRFAGYEPIAGTTACSVALDDERRGACAEPLGAFLRALHGIDPAPFVATDLPGDEIGRLDHAKRRVMTEKRLPVVLASGAVPDAGAFAAELDRQPPIPLADADRRVVHGDLYARHIVLDDGGRPAGVIDWGDVHLGDPGIDLAIAFLLLPPDAHAAFRAAYGTIDDRTWNVARYRAIYHAFLQIDYGVREDDAGMLGSGQTALRMMT
jgi:aminoglycoside phosphotransferase (APT) family kinase protein